MGGLTVAGAAHKESRKGWAAAIRNRFWFGWRNSHMPTHTRASIEELVVWNSGPPNDENNQQLYSSPSTGIGPFSDT